MKGISISVCLKKYLDPLLMYKYSIEKVLHLKAQTHFIKKGGDVVLSEGTKHTMHHLDLGQN